MQEGSRRYLKRLLPERTRAGGSDTLATHTLCTEDCSISTCGVANQDTDFDPPTLADLFQLDGENNGVYSAIKTWQTRILHIAPGKLGDELVTKLIVADVICEEGLALHQDGVRIQYDALSYTWGYPVPTQAIQCNGIAFPVIRALYIALQRIRDPKRELYLWVDAICINQKDPVEKSTQVRSMITFYRKARCVIAWLGEYGLCWEIASRSKAAPQWHTDNCEGYSDPDLLPAVVTLFSVPWATRTWVRQEVWGARNLVLRYGKHTVYLSQLRLLAERLRLDQTRFPIFGLDEDNITGHSGRLNKNQLCLRLKESGGYDATDPRDYIYGIVGMTDTLTETSQSAPEDVKGALLIDYTRSVEDVFKDATLFVASRNIVLDVLVLAWISRTLPSRLGADWQQKLPTWVPDWTVLTYNKCRHIESFLSHYFSGYGALMNEETYRKVPPFKPRWLERELGILLVGGVRLFAIKDLPELRDIEKSDEWDLNWSRAIRLNLLALPGVKITKPSSLKNQFLGRLTGYRWLIPAPCQPDDIVVLTPSSRVPLLLRKSDQVHTAAANANANQMKQLWEFVGLCFPELKRRNSSQQQTRFVGMDVFREAQTDFWVEHFNRSQTYWTEDVSERSSLNAYWII